MRCCSEGGRGGARRTECSRPRVCNPQAEVEKFPSSGGNLACWFASTPGEVKKVWGQTTPETNAFRRSAFRSRLDQTTQCSACSEVFLLQQQLQGTSSTALFVAGRDAGKAISNPKNPKNRTRKKCPRQRHTAPAQLFSAWGCAKKTGHATQRYLHG